MTKRALKGIACWHNVDKAMFENEIAPLHEPAVLRGFVNDWPIINKANMGIEELWDYLRSMYVGGDVQFARLPAEERGRFFYNKTLTALNFKREVGSLDGFLAEVLHNSSNESADSLALQSALIEEYFPKFIEENPFELFSSLSKPRIWLGNNSVVSAHHDDAENIACVVTGNRTFTLFPPEEIENLYVGPMDVTPAGAPVSLVDFARPDFEKFPKFKVALNAALTADLAPGDAIYIPALWWHHVQATGGVNLLINYWAGGSIVGEQKPVPADNLMMAMMTFRDLPQQDKNAWQAFFNYYVFSDQNDKHQHIPKAALGMLAPWDDQTKKALKKWLIRQLK